MRLLVLGATGQVGRELVAQGRAAGHRLTLLVRRESPWPQEEGLVPLQGDPLAAADLDQALTIDGGPVDAVLCSIGMQRRNPANPWSPSLSPPDLTDRLAATLAPAMARAGVRRVVAVSAAGVGDSAARLNLLMRFFLATTMIGTAYRDLDRMEQRLAASGLDWLAPRPTRLIDGPASGRIDVVPAFGLADAITRADVAAWMLSAVGMPSWPLDAWGGRTPQISAARSS